MEKLRKLMMWIGIALAAMAVWEQIRRPKVARTWEGEVLGFVPYDFRPPTVERAMSRWWNPNDDRLFMPTVFGVGWTVNFARLPKLVASGE
jgi:Family of unknown function (DUF5808)